MKIDPIRGQIVISGSKSLENLISNSNLFPHKPAILSAISISKHSTFYWFNQLDNSNSQWFSFFTSISPDNNPVPFAAKIKWKQLILADLDGAVKGAVVRALFGGKGAIIGALTGGVVLSAADLIDQL